MPASPARRFKRQQERERTKMITKIHRETLARFKNMSEEEIKREIEMFQQQYGNINQSNEASITGVEVSNG
jgi:epoxyqueuosine reductase QueG